MRRTLTWLLRIVGVAGVITAIVLLLYVFAAPGIAERRILSMLRDMGIDEASVQVNAIGTNRLQVSNIVLGEQAGLRIGAVGIDYALSGVDDVEIKTIEVVGAMLNLRWRDGELDMGPLAHITSSDEPSFDRDGVPFGKLILRSSFVLFDWQELRYAIPVEATLTHVGGGKCDIDARLWVLGVEVPLKGTIDLTAPDPASTAPEETRLADRIAFDLTSPIFGKPLGIAGSVGGEPGLSVAATIDGPAGQEPALYAALIHRDPDTQIIVRSTGEPPRLSASLPGLDVVAQGLKLDGDVRLDLASGKAKGMFSAQAASIAITQAGRQTTITRPHITLPIEAGWSQDQVVLNAGKDFALGFEGVADDAASPLVIQPFTLRSTAASLTFTRGQPASGAANRQGEWQPHLELRLASTPLHVSRGDIEISAGQISLGGHVGLDDRGQTIVDAAIVIEGGDITLPDAQLKLAGIHIALPVTVAAAPTTEAALHVESIRYKEDVFPTLKGALAVRDGVLAGNAQWPLFDNPDKPARLAMSLDLMDGFTGEVTASVRDLRITDDQTIARLVEATEAFRMTGLFNLDVRLAIDRGDIKPRITLDAREATFASQSIDFAATGISASVTLTGLAPLTTLPNQRLHMTQGHLGKLDFNNAVLNFRTDAIDAFVIELAGWSVGERGRFWTHAVRFDPAKPIIETQVFVEDMSVKEWLEILQDGELEGKGYLYGRLPVRWDAGREVPLTFGEGFLYAKPGGGWVKINDAPQVRQYLFATLEETLANLQQEAQRRLLEALNNYQFDTLQFNFIREADELLCRVTTTGRGRVGMKQEIGGLQVDIHNFGVLLSERLLRNVDSVGAIDDALRRALEGQ